jgi:hypothetical protein
MATAQAAEARLPRVRPEAGERSPPVRLRPVNRTLVVWGTAAVVYIAIGVFFTDFMLSLVIAIGYLLLATWLIPAGLRRLFL